jgi:Uma2 family endonuclease
MPTTVAPPEHRVLLRNTSWETYERLLAENESPGTRFAYDEGDMEIMVVSSGHEQVNEKLKKIVDLVAEETGKDYCAAGSTTFKKPELLKGFEPDACFYFENAGLVRDKEEIDPAKDPPPELVIEVDITRSSLNRFRIFSAMRIAEVWRYHDGRLTIHRLSGEAYGPVEQSVVLPPLTAAKATEFLRPMPNKSRLQWAREIREWVRDNR